MELVLSVAWCPNCKQTKCDCDDPQDRDKKNCRCDDQDAESGEDGRCRDGKFVCKRR